MILITGAYGNLGQAISNKFLENNMNICILGRNNEKLNILASNLKNKYPKQTIIPISESLDNQKADKWTKLIEELPKTPSVLINNAGLWSDTSLQNLTPEELTKHYNLLHGTLFLTQSILKKWVKDKIEGVIINIGSLWGEQTLKETPCASNGIMKAALHQFTKHIAEEFGEQGIRAINVIPSVLDPSANFMKNMHSLKRLATYNEVAESVLRIYQCPFITGTNIYVDGGVSSRIRGFKE